MKRRCGEVKGLKVPPLGITCSEPLGGGWGAREHRKRAGWNKRSEMKGEEEEMKRREEFLVNMCCAQLLS